MSMQKITPGTLKSRFTKVCRVLARRQICVPSTFRNSWISWLTTVILNWRIWLKKTPASVHCFLVIQWRGTCLSSIMFLEPSESGQIAGSTWRVSYKDRLLVIMSHCCMVWSSCHVPILVRMFLQVLIWVQYFDLFDCINGFIFHVNCVVMFEVYYIIQDCW